VQPPKHCSPGDSAGVLALEEEGFGFAILKAEDLAIAANIELTLFLIKKQLVLNKLVYICKGTKCFALVVAIRTRRRTLGPTGQVPCSVHFTIRAHSWIGTYLAWVDLVATEIVLVGTHDGDLGRA